jgi:DNA repair protein RadC
MKPYPNIEPESEGLKTGQSLEGVENKSKAGDASEIIDIPEIKLHYSKPCSIQFTGKITTSEISAKLLREIIGKENIQIQEHFIVLFLNRANRVIGFYKHSKGGISSTIVDAKLILSVALKSLASHIIISHNHPSGTLTPSQPDIHQTQTIQKAAKLFDIVLFDHIIITQESYYSFNDDGILDTHQSVSGLTDQDESKKQKNPKQSKIEALINKAKHLKF